MRNLASSVRAPTKTATFQKKPRSIGAFYFVRDPVILFDLISNGTGLEKFQFYSVASWQRLVSASQAAKIVSAQSSRVENHKPDYGYTINDNQILPPFHFLFADLRSTEFFLLQYQWQSGYFLSEYFLPGQKE